jgi:2-methylaconitate cis-trans-isomerase PrpF
MVEAQDGETAVSIYDVNTQSLMEAVIQTPGGRVNYQGSAAIDGVPGTSAPIILNFLEAVGVKTGKMLPTGHAIEEINGIEVSCLDVCMPMVLMRATDLGLTGIEGRAEIDGNKELLARIEAIRMEAGRRMGFGDVSDSVMPKVGLLSPPRGTGCITSRYLTPHKLHQAHAVTGAVCVATACLLEGSVAYPLAVRPEGNPCTIWIEHPTGMVDVRMDYSGSGPTLAVRKAGILRTARPIMKGEVFVPGWKL